MLAFTVDWDWSLAERAYRRALELDPPGVDARVRYAKFLAVRGRPRESIAECAKAEELNPLSMIVKVIAGFSCFWNGDSERALETGRTAIALAPDFFNTHKVAGSVLARRGQYEEAIAAFEEARRLEPNFEVLGSLGRNYGRAGRTADARKVLAELLARAKSRYVPAATIANIYDGLGDVEQCKVWMNKAITVRESRIVFIKAGADDLTRANPHFGEWMKKIGQDK